MLSLLSYVLLYGFVLRCWIQGPPDAMALKQNGQPHSVWKQKKVFDKLRHKRGQFWPNVVALCGRSQRGAMMPLRGESEDGMMIEEPIGRGKISVIAGASGYIGKSVVLESTRRGYHTVALVRDRARLFSKETDNQGKQRLLPSYAPYLKNANIVECDVENPCELAHVFESVGVKGDPVDIVISCLASRTGVKDEAQRIDYQATLNLLNAAQHVNARHFVLLSAFCVRRPLLELQRAKLKFEADLMSQRDMTYSIVRPTAFFKSVSGQLENIQKGAPYVLFGDGAVTRCNPISEEDLAYFMMESAVDEAKYNKIMNIGGPDQPLTNEMLGEMMFKALGKSPKFVYAPTWIFDASISLLQFIAAVTKSEKMEDVTEVARIGKYYAVEDMLTTEDSEKFGTITMQQHYNKIASQGQDPFTPVRATAVIARLLEVAPVMFAFCAMPIGYAFASTQFPQQETLLLHALQSSSSFLASLGHVP